MTLGMFLVAIWIGIDVVAILAIAISQLVKVCRRKLRRLRRNVKVYKMAASYLDEHGIDSL